MTALGKRTARGWLRVLTIADVVLALMIWTFVIAFMHAPFWSSEPQHHSWGDYGQTTLIVLGGSLSVVAVLVLAARWLVGRGLHFAGLLVAALPLEAAFGWVASHSSL